MDQKVAELWVSLPLSLSISLSLCLSVSPSLYLSISLSLCLSVSLSLCLSVSLSLCLSVSLSLCLSVSLSLCLSVSLSLCLSVSLSLSLSIYLSIYLSLSLSLYLSLSPSINLSIYLSFYLSVHLSVYLCIWKETILWDFLQKRKLSDPKRANPLRLPQKVEQLQNEEFSEISDLHKSKTRQFCETSFKNREVESAGDSLVPLRLWLFHPISLKYCTCHEKVRPIANPNHLMLQNASGHLFPDLRTSCARSR